jgi:hypothetical protein
MLRHACGYKLAKDGVDTRALQAYLGHRNIQNATRYTAARAGSVQGVLAGLGRWHETIRSTPVEALGLNRLSLADWRVARRGRAGYLSLKLEVEIREVWLRFKAADPALADDVLRRATAEANEWPACGLSSESPARNTLTC